MIITKYALQKLFIHLRNYTPDEKEQLADWLAMRITQFEHRGNNIALFEMGEILREFDQQIGRKLLTSKKRQ